jgi:hypothetical protein
MPPFDIGSKNRGFIPYNATFFPQKSQTNMADYAMIAFRSDLQYSAVPKKRSHT